VRPIMPLIGDEGSGVSAPAVSNLSSLILVNSADLPAYHARDRCWWRATDLLTSPCPLGLGYSAPTKGRGDPRLIRHRLARS
jgi:hypothetical protein